MDLDDFAADGSAYIYEAYSNNYGESFSAPVLVSSTSTLCVNTFGAGTPFGSCNENQYSDPLPALMETVRRLRQLQQLMRAAGQTTTISSCSQSRPMVALPLAPQY